MQSVSLAACSAGRSGFKPSAPFSTSLGAAFDILITLVMVQSARSKEGGSLSG